MPDNASNESATSMLRSAVVLALLAAGTVTTVLLSGRTEQADQPAAPATAAESKPDAVAPATKPAPGPGRTAAAPAESRDDPQPVVDPHRDARYWIEQPALLPGSYVVAHGTDADQLQSSIARATMPIYYSVGEGKVRIGQVVILGKEGGHYVGFTTSCAVTDEHPWPEEIPEPERFNQVIAIKPPGSEGLDFFVRPETTIMPDRGSALTRLMHGSDPAVVTVPARLEKVMRTSIALREGDYVELTAEGNWSVYDSGERCSPAGYRDRSNWYKRHRNMDLGALVVSDGERLRPYLNGGIGFFAHNNYNFSFQINDSRPANNSGELRVSIKIRRGVNADLLRRRRAGGNAVRVRTFGRNDVALVYFPVREDNFFGSPGEGGVPTLGVTEPTRTVRKMLARSSSAFGQKYFLYCERCDREITRVPERLRAEYKSGRAAGFTIGRQDGIRVIVSSVLKPVVGFVSAYAAGLLPADAPESVSRAVAAFTARLLLDQVLEPVWSDYVRPNWARLSPDLRDVLPPRILVDTDFDELIPREIDFGEILEIEGATLKLKDGRTFELAGVKLNTDKGGKAFLADALKAATKIMIAPYKKKKGGSILVHLLADDRYLNQLLIAVGLAKPDPKDKAFPFLNEFMEMYRRTKAKEKKEPRSPRK